MDLSKLRIPHNCADMITCTDDYYGTFYFQLIRMSNSKLIEFVDSYLNILRKLSKSLSKSDKMRAVIGCLSLHRFGYHNFTQLATTFDRTIPQIDPEYVAFTSYAAGEITLHPSQEQSRYVQHLLERCLGWIRANGKRAKHLAAAQMIKSLALNAGSSIVSFLPQFQTSIWLLLKQRSILVLESTAAMIKNLTISVSRYGRSDLDSYLSFHTQLCLRLLSYGSYIRMYGALIILEQFVCLSPGFYLKTILSLYSTITDAVARAPPHLRSAAFVTISCFAEISPKLFTEMIAEELFESTESLIRLYPKDIVRALVMLMKSIPEWMKGKINDLKKFVIDLFEMNLMHHSSSVPVSITNPTNSSNVPLKEFSSRIIEDSALTLLGNILSIFGRDALPLDSDLITKMVSLKLTESYIFCFTEISKIENAIPIEIFKKNIVSKIQIELKGKNADLALKFIAALPSTLFENNTGSLKVIDWIQSAYVSGDVKTRCEAPGAIYKASTVCKSDESQKILLELLNIAVFDESQKVRCSVLKVLRNHCNKELGQPENMKFFEIYTYDEDQEVRHIAFQILANLAEFNPLYVSAITRSSLVDYFFTIRHVNSIRQISNIVETLPDLIQASSVAIKTYSSGLIEIIMEILNQHRTNNLSYTNFLEKESENTILIRVIYSLSLLAPLDVELVSLYTDELFPLICDYLMKTENRKLALAILNLFQVLYTAPACCLAYRQKVPMIFSVCSKYLAKTNSRQIRMAILMVVGLLGVMEVHQQPMPKTLAAPENIDPDLARQFFNPSRDSDDQLDDVYLLQNQEMNDTYYISFCARSLLEVFNDESLVEYYHDAVDALVEILRSPKMSLLNYFDCFCSRILSVMEEIESNTELVYYIQMFTKLISNSTNNTAPFLARSIQLIKKRFSIELRNEFLDMILAFLTSVRDAFSPYASDTVCLLITCLDDSMMSDIEASGKALKAFSIVGIYANDLLYLIVPKICESILCEQTLPEVKIMSFTSLSTIARASDVFQSLSILVRSISYGLKSNETSIKNAAMQLVYILLKVYGTMFLNSANHLFVLIKRKKLETLEFRRLINEVNQGKHGDSFKPLENELSDDEQENNNKEKPEKPYTFSADVIIARLLTVNLGASHQIDSWLHSFIVTLIFSSPSAIIRACTPLSNLHYQFALKLFKPAFLSCFKMMKKRNRLQIINTFRQLLNLLDCSENVIREIIDLIVFMDKVEVPLLIPNDDVIRASIRYGRLAYALRLQQKIFENEMNNERHINHLIDIFVQLGDWSNAIGVWNKSKLMNRSDVNQIEIMAKLHMWDKVESFYMDRYKQYNDFEALQLLAESLASTAKWESLFNLYKDISTKNPDPIAQNIVQAGQYFAEAAMHLGQWDVLDEILKNAPDDNERVLIISAINEIHKGNFDQSEEIVDRGFSLLASSPITLWTDNQQINQKTMLIAQEFMEIKELIRWATSATNEEKSRIEEIWKERMKTVPHNFDIWFTLLANRISITNIIKDDIINLFQMKSITLGTKIHNDAFDVMFPNFNFQEAPDYHKICYIVSRYSIGDKQEAIKMMGDLAKKINGPLNTQCHYFYATWLIENDESIECQKLAYKHLKQVVIEKNHQRSSSEKQRKRHRRFSNPSNDGSSLNFLGNSNVKKPFKRTYSITDKGGLRLSTQAIRSLTTDVSNVDSLRKWAEVNNFLAQSDKADLSHITKYVTNAIDALTQCAEISPSFPDVAQLLNLFFEHANRPDVFNSTAHACIEKLHPKLLLQASPQLLIQLSHNTPAVATFVHDILFNLLCNHYHDLIFSIIVMKFSKNYRRARAADRLLKEFHNMMPQQYEEVELIRRALLKAAVTWSEKILQRIQDASDHFHRNKIDAMVATLHSILLLTSKPKCEMEYQFIEQYSDMIKELSEIITAYNERDSIHEIGKVSGMGDESSEMGDDNDTNWIQQMASWCRKMNERLCEDLKSIHVIQLSSISPQLCSKTHFSLAVAGTYRPGKPIIRIKYFVGQFNVYMTKQQPKDVVVMGEDGNYYQYLLKGHEDLRLDERIMQFFRLINSFLKKETVFQSNLIEAMTVIPLSMSHGLVQWIRGTDTLRSVVQQYRTIHNKDPLQEYQMLDSLSTKSFDLLEPIQKVQIIEKIFSEVPDTDIAEFFWLKAENAEMWLKQTNTFAITTGMTSIVCYIIGLGDRHPSNLLIDKITGKVIHIDFGDCFERAANRPFLPEVVPFRLTRMMVKAMGPTGVDGLFKSSFINMSNVLRDNKRVLVMVLAIFVHEPLIDPETFDEQEAANIPPPTQNVNHNQLPLPLPPSATNPKIKDKKKNDKEKKYQDLSSIEEDDNEEYLVNKKFLSSAATGSIIDKGRVYMIDEITVQSSVEMRNRVRQKLNGNDFEDGVSLSVEDQATRLIHNASSIYNIAKMYSGWCPFW